MTRPVFFSIRRPERTPPCLTPCLQSSNPRRIVRHRHDPPPGLVSLSKGIKRYKDNVKSVQYRAKMDAFDALRAARRRAG